MYDNEDDGYLVDVDAPATFFTQDDGHGEPTIWVHQPGDDPRPFLRRCDVPHVVRGYFERAAELLSSQPLER